MGIYFSLSIEYFGHTNKKHISDLYVSSQKGQSKFSCAVFAEHSLCAFKKDTPSLSLTWFLFRATFLTVNKYCNNPCVCLNEGKKGITILGINVTIPALETAINQSLFKFTQKGSYSTNTRVFPNMSISISIQCEANRGVS